jgi:iron complex transport system substrate-binding protein
VSATLIESVGTLAGWTAAERRTLLEALTRRKFLTASMAAFLVAHDDGKAQHGTPAATRKVVDKMGTVLVPSRLQRVIANNNATIGNMLALGMKPIGADFNTHSIPRYLGDQMEGIVDVTGEDGIDIEKALALDPDLIIAIWGIGGEGGNQQACERYKAAVATFCYKQNYVYEEDLKQNVRDVALALGVEARAGEVLAEFDRRVAALRHKVRESGFDDKPVSVVRVFDNGNYSIRVGTSESIIFRAVGIPQPPGQQNPEDFAIDLSLEHLDVLNQAYAVVVYIDDTSQVKPDQILNNDVWRLLTPVRMNRIVFVSSGVWNSIDILGAEAIVDDVESMLIPLAIEG